MRTIQIGSTLLRCKDYVCSRDTVYLPKQNLRLWLYINLTDACPASCPFCVYPSACRNGGHVHPDQLQKVLSRISPFLSGITLTGGEPMTDIPLIEDVIGAVKETVPLDIELDMVTNGLNIEKMPAIHGLHRITTVHISRHAADDELNAELMQWPGAPSLLTLKNVFSSLPDRGMTVLNCVLQKKGVHDIPSVTEYLERAAWAGAANVSLIGMFPANSYCKENHISPASFDFSEDARFSVWNHFHDHDYCHCSTGDYKALHRYIRYYYRSPGNVQGPDCCRQLVYGSDDILRAGFGQAERIDV